VGFPGETEEDFRKTLNLVKEGIFDRIKVFKYSDRPGTEASHFDNKVSDSVKTKREKILYRNIILDSIKKRSLVNLLLNIRKI
jgi:tRNA A37 methylthiotransferase MiaB